MTPEDIDHVGVALAEARRTGRKLADYPNPAPQDGRQGYAVQARMIAAMGQPVVGWKVGATSQTARDLLGVAESMSGPLFQDGVSSGPARLPLQSDDLGIVEAEIAFRMSTPLPPRQAAYGSDEVLGAVGSVHPSFEVVNKRLPGGLMDTLGWIVADGTLNQALVVGEAHPLTSADALMGETVEVSLNGTQATSGAGHNVLDGPTGVLCWLANHLSRRGIGLQTGDWVSTGLLCDILTGKSGDTFMARYATLGTLRLDFD